MHSLSAYLASLCLLCVLTIVENSSLPVSNLGDNIYAVDVGGQQQQQQQVVFDPLSIVQQQQPIINGELPQAVVPVNNVGPIQVIDPQQFKNSFKKSKSNKVSSLLHYFHGLSNDTVYDPKQVENVQEILKQPDFKRMSDEEVLKYLCSEKWTGVCEKTVRLAIEKKPHHVADIVQAIRNKPAYVNANKLLWHKLFEKAITKVEDNNYDEKLNTVINTAATKNPYLFAASKIIDKAV